MQILPPLPPGERPPIPHFTPVARKYRSDGWTPERQRAFVAALADTGSVTAAARRVNMASEGAYALRRQPDAESFAAAWEAALDHGVRRLADIAIDRAMNGVPVPIFWRGEQVGEKRWFNDRLLMFILKHHMPARYGAGLLAAPRSREQIEQEAAENCPVCKQRAVDEAEAKAKEEADRAAALAAFPSKWLMDLFKRYRAKVLSERRHRLAGEVIAADYTLRQLTHIELMLSMGGRTTEMLDMWSTEDGQTPSILHDNNLFADPVSKILDGIRREVWARQDGGLERPALPHHHRKLPPGHGQDPWPGDTQAERKAARRAAQARIAEAQAEWEAAWKEETWAVWRASRSE
ncbi:hypothetical protein D1610_15860 [Sphingomonas gilva]|uniref:Uncharacterized protein n=1 Tax=Sphingomonas gilva TaxID=2305907 RepID=A0A396RJJ0_9SPHN|nr:hypothetical protein [Sphingomonas gilva]RHW16318.1 hypothetical protein D1610_15860 [Sphingomonas gilva]